MSLEMNNALRNPISRSFAAFFPVNSWEEKINKNPIHSLSFRRDAILNLYSTDTFCMNNTTLWFTEIQIDPNEVFWPR